MQMASARASAPSLSATDHKHPLSLIFQRGIVQKQGNINLNLARILPLPTRLRHRRAAHTQCRTCEQAHLFQEELDVMTSEDVAAITAACVCIAWSFGALRLVYVFVIA